MSFGRKQSRRHVRLGEYGVLAAFASLAAGGAIGGCGSKGVSPSASQASSSSRSAAAGPATANGFVRLARGAHPLATPRNDLGRLDPNKRIEALSVYFKPSPAQQADRDALIAAQLDPSSPSYHKWLTTAEYAARFGAQASDIERTRTWLGGQGLDVKRTSPLGMRVMFSGTVGQLEGAFQTEMHSYRMGSEVHYAMASAPAIPADLADVVLALHNTHDSYAHPMTRNARVKPLATCPKGDDCGGTNGLAPPDWATIYDVPASATGANVNIGIIGAAAIAQGDITAFRSKYNLLPANTVSMILVPDTGPATATNGAGIEAILDTEWSGGIATSANITYYFVGSDDPNSYGNPDEAVAYAIEDNKVAIVSESFGGGECGIPVSDADIVATLGSSANLLGMTYLASSGDEGATSCAGAQYADGTPVTGLYVGIPAAFPGVTAVGGTEFPTGSIKYDPNTGYATAYSPAEEIWNETTSTRLGASTGGISTVFARPAYQGSIPTCTPVGSIPPGVSAATMREVPDISFASAGANNGIFIECTFNATKGDCTSTTGVEDILAIGGTSASAPAFAGVAALLSEAAGGVRLGNINPMLYALNAAGAPGFHDIVLGNNESPCTPGTDVGCPAGGKYGYAAATGYDCGSGLGSLDVAKILTSWASLAPTTISVSANPSTTTIGANVTLGASVGKTDGNPLTGKVTFTFQSYLTNQQIDESWTLGDVAPDGTGAATLSVPIPSGIVTPGTQQGVDVVAMYGGDATHLSSTSTKFHISFSAPSSFCIAPTAATIANGQSVQFASSGGVAPVRWFVDFDSTCVTSGPRGTLGTHCSTSDENTGIVTAGTGAEGYILVEAVDGLGEETFAYLTVGSAPVGDVPWADDAGITSIACPFDLDAGPLPIIDAGKDAGQDAGPGPSDDSGTPVSDDSGGPVQPPPGPDASVSDDAGPPVTGPVADASTEDGGTGSTTSKSGCGCVTAGRDEGGTSMGMIGGLVRGLGMIGRRRKR